MAATKGAIHEDLSRKDEIEGPSDRKFGFQVGGILMGLALLLMCWYRYRHGSWVSESGWGPWPWWMGAVGVVLVLAAALSPSILRPLNKAWMGLAMVLFVIVNPVVMFILWAVVMTPMGLFVRFIWRKDLLRMTLDPSAKSYWIPRDPPGPAPASMKNQF
ncbi:MAG: hypothetical protein KF724_01645 [Phycisphaeraceae bacterium]|nr:hypothetical protein [Phycisphaeraceae bacterium]